MNSRSFRLKSLKESHHGFSPLWFNQTIVAFLQILIASAFIGLLAQVAIPLGFTPVPFAFQSFAIMVVALFLGKRKGALATLAYLFQGSMGLPVFVGGSAGLLSLLGPSGGYLMAYPFQAYLIGWFVQRGYASNLQKTVGIVIAAIFLHLAMGSLWLAQFVGIEYCFMLGFYPFVFVEITKALLAAFLHNRLVASHLLDHSLG